MYYVCSTSDNRPNRPNWTSLHSHFELGWEVTTVHLDMKHLISTGQFNKDLDTVVTLKGREFLYSGLAKTEAWEDFAKRRSITDASNFSFADTVNLSKNYADTSWYNTDVYHHGPEKRYQYENQDRELILNVNHGDISQLCHEPFALVCWRYRPNHSTDRNTSLITANSIDSLLVKHYGKVYCVGLNNEVLCNGTTISQVSLEQFAGLCLRSNCKIVVGAMTGTMQLAAVLTKAPLVVYQHNDKVDADNERNHPAVLGDCVNVNRNQRWTYYQPRLPLPEFLVRLDQIIHNLAV